MYQIYTCLCVHSVSLEKNANSGYLNIQKEWPLNSESFMMLKALLSA